MKKVSERTVASLLVVGLVFCTLFMTSCGKKTLSVPMETTDSETIFVPWENKGEKQPKEYTWDEFNALTHIQRELFFEAFESDEEFDVWMEKAKADYEYETSLPCPWEKEGAKQPKDYTWDEFQALSHAKQEAFYETFESAKEYDKWEKRVKPKE